MARLNNEDWLHHAKRIPVGQQSRMFHGNEKRDNLIVGNRDDRWWAYCQSCKTGAVEHKTHVLYTGIEPPMSRDVSQPNDMRVVLALDMAEQNALATFLASKGMDWIYMPQGTAWSASRQRLMVPTKWDYDAASRLRPCEWMGRDTSGKSPQKWITYNRQHYVGEHNGEGKYALLVEDIFSFLKVQWALRSIQYDDYQVYCTLGTVIHDTLFLQLLQRHELVASFYDGDGAGYAGAVKNSTRLVGSGIGVRYPSTEQCAPIGLDPKDMDVDSIRAHVKAVFTI